MLNWYSLVSLVAMLLFWMLAAYVLTRSPRSPVSLAAVATQVAAACFLFGQLLEANAPTVEQWLAWSRPLEWSATVASAFWFWLTVLLLREQGTPLRRYLCLFSYPLGVAIAAGAVALIVASIPDGWLFTWSASGPLPLERATHFRFYAPATGAYSWVVALVVLASVGAIANAATGWRLSPDPERRHRFAWLTLSAVLLGLGSATLAATTWLGLEGVWPVWLSHLTIAVAQTMMALNVAAYNLFLRGRAIRPDFLYFLSAMTVLCLLNAAAIVLVGPAFTFELLRLLAVTSVLVIVAYALMDQGRRLLDRVFFADEVRGLRTELAAISQRAAVGSDMTSVLDRARTGIAEASALNLARLTEEALRGLTRPTALARCELAARLPRTLAARHARQAGATAATPLEDARALREVLIEAIERLKPADRERAVSDAGALQYAILREEYVLGRPNVQIMTRHSIGEGTFNRNRREAVRAMAEELVRQEEAIATAELVMAPTVRERRWGLIASLLALVARISPPRHGGRSPSPRRGESLS